MVQTTQIALGREHVDNVDKTGDHLVEGFWRLSSVGASAGVGRGVTVRATELDWNKNVDGGIDEDQ